MRQGLRLPEVEEELLQPEVDEELDGGGGVRGAAPAESGG